MDEVEEVEGSDNFAGAMAMSSISKKTRKNNIEYKLKEKRTSQVLKYNKYQRYVKTELATLPYGI